MYAQMLLRLVSLSKNNARSKDQKMSSSSFLSQHEAYIRHRVEVDRITHRQLREELQGRFPGARGCSVRSIECFCKEKGIHKSSRLSEDQVQQAVAEAVAKVTILQHLQHACCLECSLPFETLMHINLVWFITTVWTNIWPQDSDWTAGSRWNKSS